MRDFKLIDTNQFPLTLPGLVKNRFWHLCTIESSSGLEQWLYYVDLATTNLYLENFTNGQLTSDSVITDDNLWNDLNSFLEHTDLKSNKMTAFIEYKKREFGFA